MVLGKAKVEKIVGREVFGPPLTPLEKGRTFIWEDAN